MKSGRKAIALRLIMDLQECECNEIATQLQQQLNAMNNNEIWLYILRFQFNFLCSGDAELNSLSTVKTIVHY